MPSDTTTIRFLGTATVVPDAGHDTASFLINDRHLVDTGWYAPIKMKSYGVNPMDLEHVFITHCHHDHYMALPQVLFYLSMRRRERPDRPPLKIIGPAADIEQVVLLSRQFLQVGRFLDVDSEHQVIPLVPGDHYEEGTFRIETCPTRHPVQGLCYRFHDKHTGAVVSFTGDTAYSSTIAEHVRGSHLLVHEASHGPNEIGEGNRWGHAGAPDAAKIAKSAGVKQLALVHCPEDQRESAVSAAQRIFPDTLIPEDGQVVDVSAD